jgi:hypothetical protein
MFVNGDFLWRYNAQGVLLSETVLTADKPQVSHPPDSRLYTNSVGDIYLTLYGREVKRIDGQGAVLWSVDVDLYGDYDQIPVDEGLVVFHHGADTALVSLLDRDGNIAWSSEHFPESWTSYRGVDGKRIYITAGLTLTSLNTAGDVLWSQNVQNHPGRIDFSAASSNRITLIAHDKLYCYDAGGTKLWELDVPEGYSVFRRGIHLSDDLIYAFVEEGYPCRDGVLILDGDGNQLKQLDNFSIWAPRPLDAGHFTAMFNEGCKAFIGVYDAQDGSLLWKDRLPEYGKGGLPHENEIVNIYSWDRSAQLAHNGLIYFYAKDALHEWDQAGNLLRKIPTKSFIDIWVEEQMAY